ncbi:MAG: DUF4129 domain-containing protein [Chloroflexota bacterium]
MSPWQALRREIFPIAWVLMDVALLTPFALSFMRWAQFWSPGQVAFLLFLLMLLPYNLIRFMSLLKVSIDRQRWILGGIFVLVLFITLRSLLYGFSSLLDFRWITQIYRHFSETSSNLWLRDVGLFVLVLFAWGRGLALVDREPDILKVGLKMRLGALFLTPLAIWLVETRLIWDMAPFVLLYFLATLTAVSLIRAEQIEQEKTGLSASLSAGWLSSIFVANLLVVLTGGFFAFLVSGNTPAVLILWFAPALQALVQLGTVAFAAFSYLGLPLFVRLFNALQAIVFFLRRLLQPLLASWTGNAQDNAGGFGATEVLTFNDFVILTNSLNPVVKLGLLLIPIGLVVLVSLFVNRYSQRRAAERDRAGTGEKMAVFDEDDLSVGQRLLNRLGLLRNWQTAVSIRRIYAQMCRAAAGAGMPRAKTETPYEYLRSLAQVWPSNQADAELVTQAYIRVRYGEVPEDKDELAAIHAAWNRLKHTPPMTSSDASVTMPQLQKNEE